MRGSVSLLLAYRRAKPALKAGQLFWGGSGLVTMSDMVLVIESSTARKDGM
jgi:hypothetical protein